jgi:hypothetical protein
MGEFSEQSQSLVVAVADKGGICTFCGAKVALSYRDRIAQEAAAASGATAAATDPQDGGPGIGPGDLAFGLTDASNPKAATAAAVAFKDRLLEYDRHSVKRTSVIDDQSDYFEIDTNAWLTDEVGGCKELRI